MSHLDPCSQPGLMELHQAKAFLQQFTPMLTVSITCPTQLANGKVLAQDVIAPINVPPHDNSAMDGYALHTNSLTASDTLELIGTCYAGQPFEGEVGVGQCVRIMTGGVIPTTCNAVEMQEKVSVDSQMIRFNPAIKPGQHIRYKAEDIQQGQVVLPAGTRLNAPHVSLLCSLGIESLEVLRPLKVALFSSGDELIAPGKPLANGEIYDSNRPALVALLKQLDVDCIDLGVIRDDKAALRDAFLQATEQADLLITSGGVSVGEADYSKDILAELGEIGFWKLAIKPGKPFAFGKINQCVYCGLPGNPVSALVTFYQLVAPLIAHMQGKGFTERPQFQALLSGSLRKSPGRLDFQRGIFSLDEQGHYVVSSAGKQGSAMLSALTQANCFIVLEKDRGAVNEGEIVTIEPFDHLFA